MRQAPVQPHSSTRTVCGANPDPAAYVELEMLGPLKKMVAGDSIKRVSTYTLLRRREADPELEVRRLLIH